MLATPIMVKKKDTVVSNCPNAEEEVVNRPKRSVEESINDGHSRADVSELPKEALSELFYFQKRQKRGTTIDVWWLYDDGGM